MAKEVCPRLLDSASGRGGDFTQPMNFFGHLCTVPGQMDVSQEGVATGIKQKYRTNLMRMNRRRELGVGEARPRRHRTPHRPIRLVTVPGRLGGFQHCHIASFKNSLNYVPLSELARAPLCKCTMYSAVKAASHHMLLFTATNTIIAQVLLMRRERERKSDQRISEGERPNVILSYPTETVLSNKITRNRIVLSFKDSPRKPLRRRPGIPQSRPPTTRPQTPGRRLCVRKGAIAMRHV